MTPYRPSFWQWVMIVIVCLFMVYLITGCTTPLYFMDDNSLSVFWTSSKKYTCLDRAIELCQKYEAEGYQTRIGVGYPDDFLPWQTRQTHAIVEYKKDGDWERYSIGHRVPVVLEWISWQEAERRWR